MISQTQHKYDAYAQSDTLYGDREYAPKARNEFRYTVTQFPEILQQSHRLGMSPFFDMLIIGTIDYIAHNGDFLVFNIRLLSTLY
ncbi:hypothetical protein [Nitrosomonas sp. Is37]|uniref:hypothetical protein n=1 Tax=Nitrosomonas sp. Is37 TaxID=3080535 RepID=UPI00294B94C3|nr:hypothetical protein [Nitrosomonas sp. Is37]MDV6343499.1 hypothetical protein [Nitrosomonas sp. Is37]